MASMRGGLHLADTELCLCGTSCMEMITQIKLLKVATGSL